MWDGTEPPESLAARTGPSVGNCGAGRPVGWSRTVCTRSTASGCVECAPRVPGGSNSGRDRWYAGASDQLDTTRATAQLCVAHVGARMSLEELSRLVGHDRTRVTEAVYRQELRPMLTKGAEVVSRLFPGLGR